MSEVCDGGALDFESELDDAAGAAAGDMTLAFMAGARGCCVVRGGVRCALTQPVVDALDSSTAERLR